MNPKPILMTIAASLLFCSGCAAKNRWFSRKDYSEVHDPFMESDEIATADAGDIAGRASLSRGAVAAGSGPKPITRTATPAMAASAAGTGASRAAANYPDQNGAATGARSMSGPALSDFIGSGGKATPSNTPASGVAATTLGEPRSAASRPSGTNLSPAARAAAMPTLEGEDEMFSGYLQKKTDSVTRTAQNATNKVRATEDSVTDFAAWASQQKANWEEEGASAAATAKAAPAAARARVQAVSHETRAAVDNAAMDFMTPPEFEEDFSDADSDRAEPLLPKYAEKKVVTPIRRAAPIPTEEPAFDFDFESSKPTRTSATEVSDDDVNPFDNPFDTDQSSFKPATSTPPSSSRSTKPAAVKKTSAPVSSSRTRQPTIDESFDMDSGWKPSNMSRP